jgi:hypothetical protein
LDIIIYYKNAVIKNAVIKNAVIKNAVITKYSKKSKENVCKNVCKYGY